MDYFSFPVLHNDAGRVKLRPQLLGLARGNKASQIRVNYSLRIKVSTSWREEGIQKGGKGLCNLFSAKDMFLNMI